MAALAHLSVNFFASFDYSCAHGVQNSQGEQPATQAWPSLFSAACDVLASTRKLRWEYPSNYRNFFSGKPSNNLFFHILLNIRLPPSPPFPAPLCHLHKLKLCHLTGWGSLIHAAWPSYQHQATEISIHLTTQCFSTGSWSNFCGYFIYFLPTVSSWQQCHSSWSSAVLAHL